MLKGLIQRAGSNLSRSALIAMTIYVGGAASVLAMEVILARTLGVDAFGIFITVYNLVMLFVVIGRLGLDLAAIRLLTAYRVKEEWSLFHGLLRRSDLWVGAASVLLAAGLALFGWLFYAERDAAFGSTLLFGTIVLPLLALAGLRQSILFSQNSPALALFPERVLLPLGIATTVAAWAYYAGKQPDSIDAMVLTMLVALSVLISSTMLARSRIPSQVRQAPVRYRNREWLGLSLPLSGLSIAQIILSKSDIVLVGILRTPREAALYAAASTLAALVVFFITSANKVISVRFSELYSNKDKSGLQQVLTSTTCIFVILTLPVLLFLILFGPRLLSFYGDLFRAAYPILLILLIGKAVTVFCGSVGFLLAMTGNEKIASKTVIFLSLSGVVLNSIVIARFGILWAAVVTTSLGSLRSILLSYFVWRRLGLVPTCAALLFPAAKTAARQEN